MHQRRGLTSAAAGLLGAVLLVTGCSDSSDGDDNAKPPTQTVAPPAAEASTPTVHTTAPSTAGKTLPPIYAVQPLVGIWAEGQDGDTGTSGQTQLTVSPTRQLRITDGATTCSGQVAAKPHGYGYASDVDCGSEKGTYKLELTLDAPAGKEQLTVKGDRDYGDHVYRRR